MLFEKYGFLIGINFLGYQKSFSGHDEGVNVLPSLLFCHL